MPFVPVNHAGGASMVWADVAANLDLARAWANTVPQTDVADGSIRREHLERPMVQGFPLEGLDGPYQTAMSGSRGIGIPDLLWRDAWGPAAERYIIRPKHVDPVTNTWRLPIGKTGRVPPEGAAGQCLVSFDYHVRTPYGGPYYPKGAGAQTGRAGYFQLYVYDWSTRVESGIAPSVRHVYSMMDATGGAPAGTPPPWHDKVQLGGPLLFANGGADVTVSLVYQRGTAEDDIQQIDIARVQFEIELFSLEP